MSSPPSKKSRVLTQINDETNNNNNTERAKMERLEWYMAFEDDLTRQRQMVKERIYDFNHLRPSQIKERNLMLKEILSHFGDGAWIEPPFTVDYGTYTSFGEGSYANYNLIILDTAWVRVGKNCHIAPNVVLSTAGHPIHPDERKTGLEFGAPITIGDRVWLGAGVVVCPGVTIGDNCVIGAGSVVVKNIPANVVAVGNPCRVLRAITDADRNVLPPGLRKSKSSQPQPQNE